MNPYIPFLARDPEGPPRRLAYPPGPWAPTETGQFSGTGANSFSGTHSTSFSHQQTSNQIKKSQMTRRPHSHILEARSRDRVRTVLHDAGFVVDDLHQDYGEDMLVRVFRDGRATPYSFFVQVKATSQKDQASVRLRVEHLLHWQRLVQPVFVVLWRSDNESAIWEDVTYLVRKANLRQKTATLKIPEQNVLDPQGVTRMANLARTAFDLLRREQKGAQVLREVLLERTDLRSVDYSAENEVITLELPDGGAEFILFGELAEVLELRGHNSASTKDLLLQGDPRIEWLGPDGPIVYRDRYGNILQRFKNRAEQAFHHRLQDELHDMDDQLEHLRALRDALDDE